jgi:hypothetical protein
MHLSWRDHAAVLLKILTPRVEIYFGTPHKCQGNSDVIFHAAAAGATAVDMGGCLGHCITACLYTGTACVHWAQIHSCPRLYTIPGQADWCVCLGVCCKAPAISPANERAVMSHLPPLIGGTQLALTVGTAPAGEDSGGESRLTLPSGWNILYISHGVLATF